MCLQAPPCTNHLTLPIIPLNTPYIISPSEEIVVPTPSSSILPSPSSPSPPSLIPLRRSTRTISKPAWMNDFVVTLTYDDTLPIAMVSPHTRSKGTFLPYNYHLTTSIFSHVYNYFLPMCHLIENHLHITKLKWMSDRFKPCIKNSLPLRKMVMAISKYFPRQKAYCIKIGLLHKV